VNRNTFFNLNSNQIWRKRKEDEDDDDAHDGKVAKDQEP